MRLSFDPHEAVVFFERFDDRLSAGKTSAAMCRYSFELFEMF